MIGRQKVTCHTSRHLEKQNIRVFRDWPPQSPDLNIIEGLWDVLKRKVSEKKVSSRDQLWEVAFGSL